MGDLSALPRFTDDRRALSEVVGIILIIGIMVSLTAAVYVGATVLANRSSQEVAFMAGEKDEGSDFLAINHAPIDQNWGDFTITANKNVVVLLNEPAGLLISSPDSHAVPAFGQTVVDLANPPIETKAGHKIYLCGGTLILGVDQTNVVVQIMHPGANRAVLYATFSEIAACT